MERYSLLHGTDVTGAYKQLGNSRGLAGFLSRMGATDPGMTAKIVQNQISGFASLAGYEKEPVTNKPIAVRYAPMHLYKLPGMGSMRPFCALSVNGNENRKGERASEYVQTVFFSREMMHRSGDYCYLDMMFGTHLLSWQEVEDHRQNTVHINFDKLPQKIDPQVDVNNRLMSVVIMRSIEAIYQGKNVVIRLKEGLLFNNRANEMLTQIYSVIQPRLATEVGFAIYQDPNKIVDLANKVSIRFFVIPFEASLEKIPSDEYLILDLNDRESLKRVDPTPLAKILLEWMRLDWPRRRNALQALFADIDDFQNGEIFVQRSEKFFAQLKELERWKKEPGAVGTLEALRQEYNEYVSESVVPWAHQVYADIRKPVIEILAAAATFQLGKTRAISSETQEKLKTVNFLYTPMSQQEQKIAKEAYQFVSKLGKPDSAKFNEHYTKLLNELLCETVEHANEHERNIIAVYDAEKAKLEANHCAAMEAASVKHTAEVEEMNKRYIAEVDALKCDLEEQKQYYIAESKELNKHHAAEMEALNKHYTTQIEELNRKNAEEIASQKYEAQKKYESLRKKATEAYSAEKRRAEDAIRERDAARVEFEALLQKEKESRKTAVETERTRWERQVETVRRQASEAEAKARSQAETAEITRKDLEESQKEVKKLRERLAGNKPDPKHILIAGAAGFLIAVLICGIAMLSISLLGKKEVEQNHVEPAIIVTEAATEMPTEAPTEVPTETPYKIALPIDWSDERAIEWIREQLPELGCVETENLDRWVSNEMKATETYIARALFTDKAVLPEAEDETFTYALLFQKQSKIAGVGDMVEPTEAAVSTEELQVAQPDWPVAPDASLFLTGEDYVMVVFGEGQIQDTAIEVLCRIVEADAVMQLIWQNAGETVDVAEEGAAVVADKQWWRTVNTVTANEESLQALTEEKGLPVIPKAYFECDTSEIYLFDYEPESELLKWTDTIENASQWHADESERYIVLVCDKDAG